MIEYIQMRNKDNVTYIMMMDVIRIKWKIFLHLTFQFKYSKKEKQDKL